MIKNWTEKKNNLGKKLDRKCQEVNDYIIGE